MAVNINEHITHLMIIEKSGQLHHPYIYTRDYTTIILPNQSTLHDIDFKNVTNLIIVGTFRIGTLDLKNVEKFDIVLSSKYCSQCSDFPYNIKIISRLTIIVVAQDYSDICYANISRLSNQYDNIVVSNNANYGYTAYTCTNTLNKDVTCIKKQVAEQSVINKQTIDNIENLRNLVTQLSEQLAELKKSSLL